MEEIKSVNNQLVKDTLKLQQKKFRDAENKFLLEGYKAVEEAVLAGIEIDYLFVNSLNIDKYSFYNGRKILTDEIVLKKISTTDTAPEVVGVAVQKTYNPKIFKNLKKIILLEGIKDLGNLGTILRSAAAFGVDGVILYGNCADIYNPKCVRASVGNLWKIPFVYIKEFGLLENLFSDRQRTATLPRSDKYLKDYKSEDKTLIMFGSEADGLSDELINFATDDVKIEMADSVESLNLAVSCSVVAYHIMFEK